MHRSEPGNRSPSVSPRVTAVVLNWCNELETAACLESLAACRYAALSILLVDNGSADGSGERLHQRFPNIAYLQTGSNLGYAGGNNRGFRAALNDGGDYLLVLNNDTVVDPACVSALVDAAEESGAAVVAPQILYFNEPECVWYAGGTLSRVRAIGIHDGENGPADSTRARRGVSFVTGCCFLIRASVLRAAGGFDESFFAYAEDVELSIRLVKMGLRLLYEPRARVLHRIERTARPSPFQIRLRDRNRRRIAELHYGLMDRLRFACWFYPTRVVHLIRYLLAGDRARAGAIIDGAIGSLAG